MTVQTAIIITQDYGASLGTPTLRNYLTDTLIVAADSANEVTADSGRYALVFDETSVHAAGWYGLRAFVSGAPINRFVYFTGVDGETAIAVSDLPPGLPQTGQVIVTRPVGDDTPITFSFPVASATLTGTRRINNAGSTTALSGARSFLRTSGTQHLYSLAYNAADRPTDDGVVEYVFTDGTYSRTVVLKAVTAVLDSDAQAMVAAFNAMRSGNVFTAPALANAPTGGSGSGTGARTVTITVNDGTTVLQNARVRFTEGANTYTALTNASGVAVFNLDDATYTVAITKAGYNYAGTTMVVNGTETATYSMTAINITPGSGNFTTGYVTCFDQDGQVLPNCKVYQRMIEVPANDAGFAYDSSQTSATSNSEGVTEFPRLVKGGSYLFFRGSEREGTVVTIPTTAGSTYALPSVIGR
jgi:hypothetical protein